MSTIPAHDHERPIDVDRASILRLLTFARSQADLCMDSNLAQGASFWDGYRACAQEILRMEHE